MRLSIKFGLALTALSFLSEAVAVEFIPGQDVQQISSSAYVTLVEYFNPDCPHCEAMEPVISDLERLYAPHLKVFKVNSPDPVLKEIYAVGGTPEILIFKDGELRYQVKGFMAFQGLKKLIALPYSAKPGDYATLPTEITKGCCTDA